MIALGGQDLAYLKRLYLAAFMIMREREASYVEATSVAGAAGTAMVEDCVIGYYAKSFDEIIASKTSSEAEQFLLGQLVEWGNDTIDIGERLFGLKYSP
jgi:hypothetical protein